MVPKIKQIIVDNFDVVIILTVLVLTTILININSITVKPKIHAESGIEMYDLSDSITPQDTMLVSKTLEFKPKKIKYIAIHCTASKEGRFPTKERWETFFYKEKYPGKNMVGYNYLVSDKEVFELRPINCNNTLEQNEIVWGVANHNSTTVSICYVGGLDNKGKNKDTRLAYQAKALDSLVNMIHGFAPDAIVMGHGSFPKVYKSCPNYKVGPYK